MPQTAYMLIPKAINGITNHGETTTAQFREFLDAVADVFENGLMARPAAHDLIVRWSKVAL